MKILAQRGCKLIDIGKCDVEVVNNSIYAQKRANILLGEYETELRAKEVLGEIFQYVRTKKNTYIMPTF